MRHNKINNLVMVLNLFIYYNENPFYYIQTISYFSFKLLKKVFRWGYRILKCVKLDSLFWRLYWQFFVSRKLSGKRKFSKDNFLPFLIAVLLWCNIVVVLWYKLNKESFSFDILSGLHPRLLSYFRPFSSASREFRDVATFTPRDRSRRPGGNLLHFWVK